MARTSNNSGDMSLCSHATVATEKCYQFQTFKFYYIMLNILFQRVTLIALIIARFARRCCFNCIKTSKTTNLARYTVNMYVGCSIVRSRIVKIDKLSWKMIFFVRNIIYLNVNRVLWFTSQF